MKKSTLALAVLAALAAGNVAAEDKPAATVSGFADIIYMITDEASDNPAPGGENTSEGKFSANGEVDFAATPADGVTLRMDLDVSLAPVTGATDSDDADDDLDTNGDDSGSLEQAYFAWGAAEGVTVLGGVFNNPIGYEAEDAPDMDFTTHGHVYDALDGQTALDGDNIAGLAGEFAVGPATITAAFLNDISGENEENSFALVASLAPMKGLNLELGYVTQDDNVADTNNNIDTVGDVANFNIVFTGIENLALGLDYLAPSELVDSVYDVWAGYSFAGGFGAKVRYSETATNKDHSGGEFTASSTTLHLGYQIASNLSVGLEHKMNSQDNEVGADPDDTDLTQLEFIAKF